jgi:hypothetical protein
MSIRRGTVVNVFLTDEEARTAVFELRDRGFSIEQVGVAGPKSEAVAAEPEHETIVSDHSAEYGAAGLATGASLGALWGLGIVAGIMPVLGPAIAGGTLAAIFTSAAAGATVAGVAGILVGMGIPHEVLRVGTARRTRHRHSLRPRARGRSVRDHAAERWIYPLDPS